MAAFRFHPELFEIRTRVIGAMADAGFEWLSHYSAVDPLHDVHGIEVCGIREREDAVAIGKILKKLFPEWHFRPPYLKDWGRDPGWMTVVHRDAEERGDGWKRV